MMIEFANLDEVLGFLREERKLKHITQKELADYCGISLSSFQRYERGEREMPFSILDKYTEKLDLILYLDLEDVFVKE